MTKGMRRFEPMPDYSDLIAQVRPEQLDELILPFEQAISPDVTLANVRAMVGAPPLTGC